MSPHIVEIIHHREVILPVDRRAHDWLRANDVQHIATGPAGHIAVRDNHLIYRPTTDQPCRITSDWATWALKVPLPPTLIEHSVTWLFATAHIAGEHYGIARRADERGYVPLDRALSDVATRAYSRPCAVPDCTDRSHTAWETYVPTEIHGIEVSPGNPVDLCGAHAALTAGVRLGLWSRTVAHVVTRCDDEPESSGEVIYSRQ